jgi:hypothetical protein
MLDIFHKQTTKLIVAVGILLAASLFFAPNTANAAGCSAPATDYGTVTSTLSVPTTGTYRVWSRLAVPDTTNNSYLLDIDGTSCFTVGDSAGITTSAGLTATPPTGTINWVWVDYQAGTSTNKINVSLSAGNHTFKMIGNAPNVALDRIVITQDTTCIPSGTGDNCANPADTTKPAVSITSPSNGATVTGVVTVSASASDDSGTVSKVEFYIDGSSTPAASDSSSPYSYSWNTASLTGGSSHTISAKAYDPSGNTQVSTVSVTIQQPLLPGDTDNNSKVNILDLLAVINHWGETNQTRANGELDNASPAVINIGDLLQVLNNWNP